MFSLTNFYKSITLVTSCAVHTGVEATKGLLGNPSPGIFTPTMVVTRSFIKH